MGCIFTKLANARPLIFVEVNRSVLPNYILLKDYLIEHKAIPEEDYDIDYFKDKERYLRVVFSNPEAVRKWRTDKAVIEGNKITNDALLRTERLGVLG